MHLSTVSTSPRTLSSWSLVRPVPCNSLLLFSLISLVSSFSPEPSTSPRRERKTRSGRVPRPTPSSSFPKCCFNSSILPGKAFRYRSSLILVDHCTRSHQRGNPRVHPAFPALLGAAQNRVEFGQHAAQSNSTRSSLRRLAVRFFLICFMLFRSLSSIMGVSENTPAPIGILFPELANALAGESVSLQEVEKIAGGDGDMVLSLRKHKMVAIPPYTMYVVALLSPSES